MEKRFFWELRTQARPKLKGQNDSPADDRTKEAVPGPASLARLRSKGRLDDNSRENPAAQDFLADESLPHFPLLASPVLPRQARQSSEGPATSIPKQKEAAGEPETSPHSALTNPSDDNDGSERTMPQSHAGSSGQQGQNPRRDARDNKEWGIPLARQPSHAKGSETVVQTEAYQKLSDGPEPNSPDTFKKSPPPLLGLASGEERAAPAMAPTSSAPAPIFITLDETDDMDFAPFYNCSPQKPGESVTDVMIRDQIRRSALLLGRPLTADEEGHIRSTYLELAGYNAPRDDVSEPGSEHSTAWRVLMDGSPRSLCALGGDSSSGSGSGSGSGSADRGDRGDGAGHSNDPSSSDWASSGHDVDEQESKRGETAGRPTADRRVVARLRERVAALERRVDETDAELASEQRRLNEAFMDGAQLWRWKRDAQERLSALEWELRGIRGELSELRRRRRSTAEDGDGDEDEGTQSSDHGSSSGSGSGSGDDEDEDEDGVQSLRGECIMAAIAMLLWIFIDSLLRSMRLRDGFGPYINGGYNGLGSVLVFHSWTQFSLFAVALVYLGSLVISAVLGR